MQQQPDVARLSFRIRRGLLCEQLKPGLTAEVGRGGFVAHQGAPKLRGMAPTALSPVTIWNTLAASAISESLT